MPAWPQPAAALSTPTSLPTQQPCRGPCWNWKPLRTRTMPFTHDGRSLPRRRGEAGCRRTHFWREPGPIGRPIIPCSLVPSFPCSLVPLFHVPSFPVFFPHEDSASIPALSLARRLAGRGDILPHRGCHHIYDATARHSHGRHDRRSFAAHSPRHGARLRNGGDGAAGAGSGMGHLQAAGGPGAHVPSDRNDRPHSLLAVQRRSSHGARPECRRRDDRCCGALRSGSHAFRKAPQLERTRGTSHSAVRDCDGSAGSFGRNSTGIASTDFALRTCRGTPPARKVLPEATPFSFDRIAIIGESLVRFYLLINCHSRRNRTGRRGRRWLGYLAEHRGLTSHAAGWEDCRGCAR